MASSERPRGDDRGRRDGGHGVRTIALIGPFSSGKTTLLEAILERTGKLKRAGAVADGTSLGDASPEARAHAMSTSLNIAETDFLGDRYVFIDCPGSVEFTHEGELALPACDAAVVVCEPDDKRLPALQSIFRKLEEQQIPHLLFLNKIDSCQTPVRDIIPALQPATTQPLVLRQIPIWENGNATGFIDLALERAFVYRPHAQSEVIDLPKDMAAREQEARFQMLEKLADYDDSLMEKLLEDIQPDNDEVFNDLTNELRAGQICPVLLGSAENGNGILRLLKVLRHEVPSVELTAERLGLANESSTVYAFKTTHSKAGGKLTMVRVLRGSVPDGATLTDQNDNEERAAGLFSINGEATDKRGGAETGEVLALGRLDSIQSGQTLATDGKPDAAVVAPEPPTAVVAIGLGLRDRKDEVKLSAAMAKLIEEDPALRLEQKPDLHQILLHGQGEMHLRVALERLSRKYGIEVSRESRRIGYMETIQSGTELRARHKKQSGGHGQFGDVVIEIKPLPRGSGIRFSDSITGGAIPKTFIPAVEAGVRDQLQEGPLGFPVVDISIELKDGSYHSVDSSEMAFRQAGRLAMQDGLPKCTPVLLEPVMAVTIAVPSDANARINSIISQRRGQILGFEAREGWPGWDVFEAHIPDAEMDGLIVDLRSATAGAGSFTSKFDHLSELTGRQRDQVLATREAAE